MKPACVGVVSPDFSGCFPWAAILPPVARFGVQGAVAGDLRRNNVQTFALARVASRANHHLWTRTFGAVSIPSTAGLDAFCCGQFFGWPNHGTKVAPSTASLWPGCSCWATWVSAFCQLGNFPAPQTERLQPEASRGSDPVRLERAPDGVAVKRKTSLATTGGTWRNVLPANAATRREVCF